MRYMFTALLAVPFGLFQFQSAGLASCCLTSLLLRFVDDMYTEEYGSIVEEQMVYTILFRHRDCDPEGWHKCKACTCPEDPPPEK